MAKSFSASDAKKLIVTHEQLINELKDSKNILDSIKKSIRKTAEKMIAQEVMKILREVPVEELNREKRGIKIKLLQEAGFDSVADVYSASAYNLSSIRGISQESAQLIKKLSDNIAYQARQGAKIRISTDNKSKSASLAAFQRSYRGRGTEILSEY